MKSHTISEAFSQAIGERTVLNGFFSTYCFEPDFFELEVVPLLLGSPAVSRNETLRYLQLQDQMRLQPIKLALAYDNDVFFPELAPRLEVDYLPIRVDGACQHAKLALLEVENADGASTSLILVAGSFNMTKAGWWDNIEVGHWVELRDAYAPANIVQALKLALDYFNGHQKSLVLGALLTRLQALEPGKPDPGCTFYFSGAGSERLSFPAFIKQATFDKKANSGPIEIVSPFFSEGGSNETISAFLAQFETVSMFLPTDIHGNGLMQKTVYEALSQLPVTWATWRTQVQKDYGMSGEVQKESGMSAERAVFRKLHAKMYCYLGDQPWIFAGSVNLSYKAFAANVEAGFLLRPATCKSLLLARKEVPATFIEEAEAGTTSSDTETSMPVIELTYDWEQASLQMTSSRSGSLTLLDKTSAPLGRFELACDEALTHPGAAFARHLQQSALINARWQDAGTGASCERILLVSQRKVFCRPSILPAMSLQNLLRIFQDMDEASRAALIDTLAAQHISLADNGALGDENAPPLPPATDSQSFFSEFSQVNGAFWMLKNYLAQTLKNGQNNILDYYFKGCQPDSLRGVLKALEPSEPALAPSLIVRYLTLLSVDELLRLYPRFADAALKQQVMAAIHHTEQDAQFSAMPEKDRFLAWIKEKFYMSVADIAKAGQTGDGVTGVPHA